MLTFMYSEAINVLFEARACVTLKKTAVVK